MYFLDDKVASDYKNLDAELFKELYVKTKTERGQSTADYTYVVTSSGETLAEFTYESLSDTHGASYHSKLTQAERLALKEKFSDEFVRSDATILIAEYVAYHKNCPLHFDEKYGQCIHHSDVEEI